MSLQKLQRTVSNLESQNQELVAQAHDLTVQNQDLVAQNEELAAQSRDLLTQVDDLKYRLSFYSGDETGSLGSVEKLLQENVDLRKQLEELELRVDSERHEIADRETALLRIVGTLQVPESVLETVQCRVEDERERERELVRVQIARAEEEVMTREEDLLARDQIIDQLEISIENLRKEYQESYDILSYDLGQKAGDLELRLRQADHVINQQADQIDQQAVRLDQQAVRIEKLSTSLQESREMEDLYSELVAQFNDQVQRNEELNDKLTATEFDLYATVEKLDLLQISDQTTLSVGVGTDPLSPSLSSSRDLRDLSDKYESSQYQVTELSIENSALECRIEELEHQLTLCNEDQPTSEVKEPARMERRVRELSRQSGDLENQLVGVEEENRKLLLDVNELDQENRRLIVQIEAYENEIFELSERVSEAETEPETRVLEVTRRLSSMLEQAPFRRPDQGRRHKEIA